MEERRKFAEGKHTPKSKMAYRDDLSFVDAARRKIDGSRSERLHEWRSAFDGRRPPASRRVGL